MHLLRETSSGQRRERRLHHGPVSIWKSTEQGGGEQDKQRKISRPVLTELLVSEFHSQPGRLYLHRA